MFATFVCGLATGSTRAHYMSVVGRGGYGLELYGCGADAGLNEICGVQGRLPR